MEMDPSAIGFLASQNEVFIPRAFSFSVGNRRIQIAMGNWEKFLNGVEYTPY